MRKSKSSKFFVFNTRQWCESHPLRHSTHLRLACGEPKIRSWQATAGENALSERSESKGSHSSLPAWNNLSENFRFGALHTGQAGPLVARPLLPNKPDTSAPFAARRGASLVPASLRA